MKPQPPYRKILPIEQIGKELADIMFRMLNAYYGNTTRENFERDLSSKTFVICLFEPMNNNLVGFSTLKEFYHSVDGKEYMILYSGDTIIEKEYWGSQALVMGFGEHMISMIRRFPDHQIFWFLISKGIRTYRYLPVFFREYYPHHRVDTPQKHQSIMDSVARKLFADAYVQDRGIIAMENGQYLKGEFIPQPNLANEVEAFYYKMNPGHAIGEELVCLAALRADNVCDHIKRVLKI
jgi:hypothetical protein